MEEDFYDEAVPVYAVDDTSIDEDIDFEAVVEAYTEAMARQEAGVAVLDFAELSKMDTMHRVMRAIVSGKRVSVSYELNEPYASMGSVSVEGKQIVIEYPKLFALVMETASNFNVYPKTNGTVRIDFTFNGLTRKVEDLRDE